MFLIVQISSIFNFFHSGGFFYTYHARIHEFSPGGVGGPDQSDKKNSDNVFFFFFL